MEYPEGRRTPPTGQEVLVCQRRSSVSQMPCSCVNRRLDPYSLSAAAPPDTCVHTPPSAISLIPLVNAHIPDESVIVGHPSIFFPHPQKTLGVVFKGHISFPPLNAGLYPDLCLRAQSVPISGVRPLPLR